jgi:hypothetical protein
MGARHEPDVCNPSTLEADTEGWGVGGQPGLLNEALSQRLINNNNNLADGEVKGGKILTKIIVIGSIS